MRFHIGKSPDIDGIWFYFLQDRNDFRDTYVCQPLVFKKKIEEGGLLGEPAMILNRAEAMAMLNELWDAGIRPNGWNRPDGELGAVRYHLEDMRKMVFGGIHENGANKPGTPR